MAAESVLVGVDVGTSSIKVGAFGLDGRLIALARRPTPTTRSSSGFVDHDPEALWASVAASLRELVATLPLGADVLGVACDSVGEAGLPLDASMAPLRPAIAWYDERAQVEAEELGRAIGTRDIYRISGQALDPHYGMLRLLWLRRHEPAVFGRTAHWASLADWIAFRLTGVLATDPSLASRTLAFDQAARTWSRDLLTGAGLSPELLPAIAEAGTRIGSVTSDAATATGLKGGTPVVLAGHDRLCAALASRGGRDDPVDSTGSAEALVLPTPVYRPADPEDTGYVSQYADVVPGGYVFSARVGYAGALVDWIDRELGTRHGLEPAASATVTRLDDIAPRPLRFSGLLVLPTFGRVVSPFWEPAARYGAIIGLTLGHGRGAIVQALAEATCYSLRANLELLERITGRELLAIAAEGAMVHDRTWLTLKAAVTGRLVVAVDLPEATALGAALLAGVGVGAYEDHQAASRSVRANPISIEPDQELASTYERTYRDGYVRLPAIVAALAPALATGETSRTS